MAGDGKHSNRRRLSPTGHENASLIKSSEDSFSSPWEGVDDDDSSSSSNKLCDYYEKAKTRFMNEIIHKKLRKMAHQKKIRRFWRLNSESDPESCADNIDSDAEYFKSRKAILTQKILKEVESITECKEAKIVAGNVILGFEDSKSPIYTKMCPHQVFLNGLIEAMLQYNISYLQKMFPTLTKSYLKEMIADFARYILKIAQQPFNAFAGEKSRYRLKTSIFKQTPETFLKTNMHNIVSCGKSDNESEDDNFGMEESSTDLEEKDVWNPKPFLSKVYDHPGCSTMIRLFTGIKIKWRLGKKVREREYNRRNLAFSNRIGIHQRKQQQQQDHDPSFRYTETGGRGTHFSRNDQWKMMVDSGFPTNAKL